MTLTDSQKELSRQWLADGMKLSEFQKQVEKEFGLRLTYMETRFLVDDLKVLPKDSEPPVKPEPVKPAPAPAVPGGEVPGAEGVAGPVDAGLGDAAAPAGGSVDVTVDVVTRPGMVVSGRVTFSDGQVGTWYVDQYGRPGLVPDTKGYRPPNADLQQFQVALERELTKLGL